MFLAAAVNRRDTAFLPQTYDLSPTKVRPFSLFAKLCRRFSGTVAKTGWRHFSKCRGRPCASPHRRQAVCTCQMDAEDKRRSGVRAGTGPAPTRGTNTVLLLIRFLQVAKENRQKDCNYHIILCEIFGSFAKNVYLCSY